MVLAACALVGTPEYHVRLRNGHTIVSRGWPALDDRTGNYVIRRPSGALATVVEDEVLEIYPSKRRANASSSSNSNRSR